MLNTLHKLMEKNKNRHLTFLVSAVSSIQATLYSLLLLLLGYMECVVYVSCVCVCVVCVCVVCVMCVYVYLRVYLVSKI